MLTLGHLRTFLAVAKRQSLRAAARDPYVSEPSVSAHVASLERFFGTHLFERGSRGVTLTEAGQVVKVYAEQVLSETNNAQRTLAALSRPVRSGTSGWESPGRLNPGLCLSYRNFLATMPLYAVALKLATPLD